MLSSITAYTLMKKLVAAMLNILDWVYLLAFPVSTLFCNMLSHRFVLRYMSSRAMIIMIKNTMPTMLNDKMYRALGVLRSS